MKEDDEAVKERSSSETETSNEAELALEEETNALMNIPTAADSDETKAESEDEVDSEQRRLSSVTDSEKLDSIDEEGADEDHRTDNEKDATHSTNDEQEASSSTSDQKGEDTRDKQLESTSDENGEEHQSSDDNGEDHSSVAGSIIDSQSQEGKESSHSEEYVTVRTISKRTGSMREYRVLKGTSIKAVVGKYARDTHKNASKLSATRVRHFDYDKHPGEGFLSCCRHRLAGCCISSSSSYESPTSNTRIENQPQHASPKRKSNGQIVHFSGGAHEPEYNDWRWFSGLCCF